MRSLGLRSLSGVWFERCITRIRLVCWSLECMALGRNILFMEGIDLVPLISNLLLQPYSALSATYVCCCQPYVTLGM
jgi:hypothetical protein